MGLYSPVLFQIFSTELPRRYNSHFVYKTDQFVELVDEFMVTWFRSDMVDVSCDCTVLSSVSVVDNVNFCIIFKIYEM